MKLIFKSVAALSLLVSIGMAQTAPATRPATQDAPPPTPEQQKILQEVRNQDPAKPAQKIDGNRLVPREGGPNENFCKVDRKWIETHDAILKSKVGRQIDLVFLGDSITQRWNQDIWKSRYAKLNAINFGIGGDRTQHVLWRIQDGGELDGIQPKLVVLMIGTNNGFYNKAPEIAAGIEKIVETIHAKLPTTKVLVLSLLPRSPAILDRRGKPDSQRKIVRDINDLIAKLDNGKTTRYLEIWDAFLDKEGNIPADLMPDALHPSAKGYQIIADAMQPLLDEMMR